MSNKNSTIELGDLVRDKVTGFEGVVVGTSTFLHGCTRIAVQSQKLKDGKPSEAQWFDEPQLELRKKRVVEPAPRNQTAAAEAVAERKQHTGGPMPHTPTRSLTPAR